MIEIRDAEGGATVKVRVSPRAAREGFAGEREGALVIRVAAPPVDGAANAALARLVSRFLEVRASAVTVRRGTTSRDKLLHIRGMGAAALRARVDALAAVAAR